MRADAGRGAGEGDAARLFCDGGELPLLLDGVERGAGLGDGARPAALGADVCGERLLAADDGAVERPLLALLVGGRPLADAGAAAAAAAGVGAGAGTFTGSGRETVRTGGGAGLPLAAAGGAGAASDGFFGAGTAGAGAFGAGTAAFADAGAGAEDACFARSASVTLTLVPQKMQNASAWETSRLHLMQLSAAALLLLETAGAAVEDATFSVPGAIFLFLSFWIYASGGIRRSSPSLLPRVSPSSASSPRTEREREREREVASDGNARMNAPTADGADGRADGGRKEACASRAEPWKRE